jgi:hypothetical protein
LPSPPPPPPHPDFADEFGMSEPLPSISDRLTIKHETLRRVVARGVILKCLHDQVTNPHVVVSFMEAQAAEKA